MKLNNNHSKTKKIIFVIGHGRSGTTMLNKVLSAHPNISFINSEFDDLPFFFTYWNSYNQCGTNRTMMIAKDMFSILNLKKNFYDQYLDFFKVETMNFKEFMNTFFDFFRWKNNCNLVGIKIANNFHENIELIANLFDTAFCIHIIRDPRDIFLSIKKASFGTFSPYYSAISWKNAINKIITLKNKKLNYYEIKYESLITNPEKEVKKLCRFLQMPFSKNMMNFQRKIKKTDIHHKFLKKGFVSNNFNKWKKELTKKELELIYAAAGKEIYKFGYSKEFLDQKISNATRFREYFFDKILITYSKLRTLKLLKNKKKMYKTKIQIARKLSR
ncbi:MAG: sulfotransferase [DPANN group archaeon]|nr:sulfotransferase [DPANN group archaeon]